MHPHILRVYAPAVSFQGGRAFAISAKRGICSTKAASNNAGDQPIDGNSLPGHEEGLAYLNARGYDMDSVWSQTICWNDLDSFRHVNNVRYAMFIESARIKYMERLAEETGDAKRRSQLLAGHGIGLILKSLSIRYRRPVVYPDTLLLSQKPHSSTPTQFTLSTLVYSTAQKAPVATAESECVWYDYDRLKKCEGPEDMMKALQTTFR